MTDSANLPAHIVSRHPRKPAWLLRHPILVGSVVLTLLAAVYWGLVASDRYVSDAHVVVDRTDLQTSQGMDFATLVTGGRNNHDLMLLRDHLRSVDMLLKLDTQLKLKAHYSDTKRDPLSRM